MWHDSFKVRWSLRSTWVSQGTYINVTWVNRATYEYVTHSRDTNHDDCSVAPARRSESRHVKICDMSEQRYLWIFDVTHSCDRLSHVTWLNHATWLIQFMWTAAQLTHEWAMSHTCHTWFAYTHSHDRVFPSIDLVCSEYLPKKGPEISRCRQAKCCKPSSISD